jgi:hypothetical protein
MTIEIHKPELEALIIERLRSGGFESVEDLLLQALQSSKSPPKREIRTGADLVAAMQASPYKEIDLEPARESMPVRPTLGLRFCLRLFFSYSPACSLGYDC